MSRAILQELTPANVDHYEILDLIQSHYATGQSTPDNCVLYPASTSYALKIRFNKGQIRSIEATSNFTTTDRVALRAKIQTQLIDSAGVAVERCIMFSSRPVKGSFRSASGLIQILPPPSNALEVYGQHPFVFEF